MFFLELKLHLVIGKIHHILADYRQLVEQFIQLNDFLILFHHDFDIQKFCSTTNENFLGYFFNCLLWVVQVHKRHSFIAPSMYIRNYKTDHQAI